MTKLKLREIVYSDNSKAKYLIVNNETGCGRVKITWKQWKFFKQLGIDLDTINAATTEQNLNYILS